LLFWTWTGPLPGW